MDSAKMEQYRKQLHVLSSQVRSTVSAVTDQARGAASGQGTGELSQVPLHLADMGSEEYLYELNTTLLENEEYLANEISAALRRIDAGTFGTCESCKKAIAAERLKALPYTRYCVQCAAAINDNPRVNLNVGRPRSPNDTMAPEGDMNEDFSDSSQVVRTSIDDEVSQSRFSADTHAAGTAGGGTAIGGLAGSNIGRGEPSIADLQDATGSGDYDVAEDREEELQRGRSGRSGGAIGGTPAGKRSR
jgi:RNA polymerase-binding transcription factor DksA